LLDTIYDALEKTKKREYELERAVLTNEISLEDLRQELANKKRGHVHKEENENTAHSLKIMEGNRVHFSTPNASSTHPQIFSNPQFQQISSMVPEQV